MTRTLLDLKNRIASDLSRDDLTSQIANAVGDTIRFYARERFWFNQTKNQPLNTVPGQALYGAADLITIPNIIRIDALYLLQNQSVYPLDRYEPEDFELISASTGGGRPSAYTYSDQNISLWPVPNAIYPLRLHCFVRWDTALFGFADPLVDGATTPWTDDAEELVRSHAKMLLYMDVLADDENAQRMSAKIPALLGALRAETSNRMATGRIRPTEF